MRPLTSEQRSILLYMAKTVTGVVLLVGAGSVLAIPDVSWVIISMLLVLSPDSKEAMPLTLVRIKANLVASVASMAFLMIAPTTLLAICLAIIVTILVCYLLDLMAGSRVALAAVVIILLHTHGEHVWSTPIERVLAVIVGCVIGLLLTFVFHREIPLRIGAGKANPPLNAGE